MRNFAFHSLLLALLLSPASAWAYALTCTNPSGYTYYTNNESIASKCRYSYDKDCNWKSTSSGCRWDGSFKGTPSATSTSTQTATQSKTQTSTQTMTKTATQSATKTATSSATNTVSSVTKTATQTATKTATQTATKTASQSKTATQTQTATQSATQTQTAAETATEATDTETTEEPQANTLAEAMKEGELAANKVEQLKVTMEELKVNNENNAILYRSPDANLGSVDGKYNAFGSVISGGAAGSAGAWGKSGLEDGRPKSGSISERNKNGRKLASADKNGEYGKDGNTSGGAGSEASNDHTGASLKGEGNSATSDNPWVTYMGQTSKAGLIDRLRKNPSLRDSLRDRIAELQSSGDQSGVIELLEEALTASEKEGQPTLDDLKPMTVKEAFSMDAGETEAQIRNLLADLDVPSDPQFLPQESLFQRISVAHRRSLVRGSLKTNH